MTDLEWTDEPPEEEGLYIVAEPTPSLDWRFSTEQACYVEDVNGEGFTGWIAKRAHNMYKPISKFSDRVMWAGPIPEPDEPDA